MCLRLSLRKVVFVFSCFNEIFYSFYFYLNKIGVSFWVELFGILDIVVLWYGNLNCLIKWYFKFYLMLNFLKIRIRIGNLIF